MTFSKVKSKSTNCNKGCNSCLLCWLMWNCGDKTIQYRENGIQTFALTHVYIRDSERDFFNTAPVAVG